MVMELYLNSKRRWYEEESVVTKKESRAVRRGEKHRWLRCGVFDERGEMSEGYKCRRLGEDFRPF